MRSSKPILTPTENIPIPPKKNNSPGCWSIRFFPETPTYTPPFLNQNDWKNKMKNTFIREELSPGNEGFFPGSPPNKNESLNVKNPSNIDRPSSPSPKRSS